MKNNEPRIIRAFTPFRSSFNQNLPDLDLDLVLNGERNADQGQGGWYLRLIGSGKSGNNQEINNNLAMMGPLLGDQQK